ncbi:MAG: hypothetical protein Q7T04_03130 [Dehalococcoidia bacterium]|nr:hypothetical protein [Dehalococcoidia bacterium]
MGLFNFNKKKAEEQTAPSASDSAILADFLKNGVPCIPFIPISALRDSLSILKPEGFKGYFVARTPALYPDGSIRYLLKEEFMLYNVANSALSSTESKGRTYFFLGFDELLTSYEESRDRYLAPTIFYQNNRTLFRVDTNDKLEFAHLSHSPTLDLTYIPADHNVHFNHIYAVNFLLVANLHPAEERGDPSGFLSSFEQWRELQYPTGGKDLQALFDRHIQGLKDSLK